MILRHATLLRNLPSIRRHGLLCSKSQGRLPVVWLHSPSKSDWAALHTVKRHGGRVERVIIIEVDVPRSWLRRSRRKLWCCPRDIPRECFRRLITFAELAGLSVDAMRQTERRPLARIAC
jgi:hypothetical protein